MMILIDFKTFDDDSCKLDFENPGIATSCCCSISATDSKDQLKQTTTLCRGLNVFGKFRGVEKFDTTNLHSAQRFKHFFLRIQIY